LNESTQSTVMSKLKCEAPRPSLPTNQFGSVVGGIREYVDPLRLDAADRPTQLVPELVAPLQPFARLRHVASALLPSRCTTWRKPFRLCE